jgi:hypothetical protein
LKDRFHSSNDLQEKRSVLSMDDPTKTPQPEATSPPPVPQPPAIFQSVEEVVNGALSQLPELIECQDELTLLATMWVRFINPPTGGQAPKDKAGRLLNTLMGKTFDDVRTSVRAVNSILTKSRVELAAQYSELTGTKIDPVELDLGTRYQEERAEHSELNRQANEVLATVARLAAFYGFENPDPALKTDEPAKKEGLGERLTRIAVEKLNDVPAEPVEELDAPELAWSTPPVLVLENPEIERFMVVAGESVGNQQTALSGLQAFDINLTDIQEMSENAAETAREQLEVSATILTNVDTDNREFALRIRTHMDVGQLVGANDIYVG